MRFDECSDRIVEIINEVSSECPDDSTDDEIRNKLDQKLENETCFKGLSEEEMVMSLVLAAVKLASANV